MHVLPLQLMLPHLPPKQHVKTSCNEQKKHITEINARGQNSSDIN